MKTVYIIISILVIISSCKIEDKNNETELERFYCTPESREGDVCILLYDPVCGWYGNNTAYCIEYPCAHTFSNSCFACLDRNVLYYTKGECPE